jgi:DNA-binding CsgD family transcriptional regulator
MTFDVQAIQRAFDRAAFAPEAWPETLRIAGEALNSRLFGLIRFFDNDADMLTPPDAVGQFERYRQGEWFERDPRGRRARMGPEMEVITDDHLLAPGERETSDFYRDYAAKEDIPFCAHWRFNDGERQFVFTNARSGDSGPAREVDMEAMRAIRDRATAAALLSAQMHHAREHGLVEGLSAAGASAIVLGHSGKVIAATPRAETLMAGDFSLHEGRLACDHPAASDALLRLCARLGARRTAFETPAFHVPRPGGRGVTCYPVANEGPGLDIFTDVRAVLLLKDADAPVQPRSDMLASKFSLTPAEIDVAGQLASGASLQSISSARGVALATTRTILRSIFRKTGVRRQSELAALIARM